jgi:hypothetical protein
VQILLPISTKTKISIVTYVLFFLILSIGASLFWYEYLSNAQFFIFSFGNLGMFLIALSMIRLTADSILNRHRIIFTATIITILVLLSTYFIAIDLQGLYALIFFLGIMLIDFCILGVDWNAKRKQTPATNETINIL